MRSKNVVHELEVGSKCVDDGNAETNELIQKIVIELMDFTVEELAAYKAEWKAALAQRGIPRDLITYCGKIVDAVSEYKEGTQ